MPKVSKLWQLFRRVLRVMDQNVHASRELQRRAVQLTDAGRTRPERERIVVGEVRDGPGFVAYPESECAAAFVRDLSGDNHEPLEFVLALVDRAEAPAVPERARLNRKVWRGERSRQHALGVGLLLGNQDLNPMARPTARRKEWQALCVIPVQVAKKNRAVEGRVSKKPIQIRQACATVKDQVWSGAVMRERYAGGMSPVPDVGLAWRRGGPSNAAEEQFHPVASLLA